ncbi:meiosis-specific protein ASY3 [Arachis stenosperma]|uniref:meiosis-specific protein ASY3 n=1 Tax=Arachis stenosperma TaxID=217475 RepID=UPI0025AD8916|nr:meiosis-specific protein ASY3 [Arachis stenosperma]
MNIKARQVLHDEPMSDCRSFGSNIYPSSQSRKVSIGVMAESRASTKCETAKGDRAITVNKERAISNVGNFAVGTERVEGVTASASFDIKQTIVPEAVKHSFISKSFYHRKPTSEAIIQVNQASTVLPPHGKQDMDDGVESVSKKISAQLFSNLNSTVPSSNCNQNKFDRDTGRKKGKKDGTVETVEEFTFTTGREVLETDKDKPEDKLDRTGNRTEDLRMKLCQILGTASSPKNQTQHSGSHTRSKDEERLPLEQPMNQRDNKFLKTRENSDTIETDSEKPDYTRKRPVTRSQRKRRAPSKKQPGKGKSCPSSKEKENHQEKGIFSIRENWNGMHDALTKDTSSMSTKKKSQGKNSRSEPQKFCFSKHDTMKKLYKDTSKNDQSQHVVETFLPKDKMGGSKDCLPDHGITSPHSEKINQEKKIYNPPTPNDTDQDEELEVSANGNKQEYGSNPVEQNVTKSQDNFQSPTFQLNTPNLDSSPSTLQKTDQKLNDGSTPASSERRFSLGASQYLRAFQTLEPDFDGLREQKQSSDVEELRHFIPRKHIFVNEKEEQDGTSDSSSEEKNFSGSEEGSRERHTAEGNTFMLHPIKRLRKHEGVKFNHSSPTSLSTKGTEEIHWIDEAPTQNQDEFARAVGLFAMELSKLKSKLRSMACHKSSEILKSVSEEIDLQLQNVHSHIQTEMGKLTNLSKFKRKRIEAKFEDQQKQLRLICDRFKEEVNLHLQDCKSTIEDLDIDQIEIKGSLEKQRVAHKKLISQVQEEVDIQLNDAQKKITAAQEMARGKLLQLKRVIAMCLKDGVLN